MRSLLALMLTECHKPSFRARPAKETEGQAWGGVAGAPGGGPSLPARSPTLREAALSPCSQQPPAASQEALFFLTAPRNSSLFKRGDSFGALPEQHEGKPRRVCNYSHRHGTMN